MNTTENNKLIAEFMGWRCESSIYWVPQFTRDYLSTGAGICDTHNFYGHQLLFHKDWNWIMTVVEKIDKVEIEIPEDSNLIGDITYGLVSVNIEITYEAIIEFIKWYNNNLKTK